MKTGLKFIAHLFSLGCPAVFLNRLLIDGYDFVQEQKKTRRFDFLGKLNFCEFRIRGLILDGKIKSEIALIPNHKPLSHVRKIAEILDFVASSIKM